MRSVRSYLAVVAPLSAIFAVGICGMHASSAPAGLPGSVPTASVVRAGDDGDSGWGRKVTAAGGDDDSGWGHKVTAAGGDGDSGWGHKATAAGDDGDSGWGRRATASVDDGDSGWGRGITAATVAEAGDDNAVSGWA
ncbi:hypothetical protein [Streptomyces panaciradicis]|uniref:hypothetical protein n=1 Tax=Streptomyces panaciradicis TaxID=1470261 RepID=UPI00201D1143|nr:hypothetical protein [Streptomyces panaciradicis]MCL6673336.1 hypothetical protein [Streptomyces panaciradicis]